MSDVKKIKEILPLHTKLMLAGLDLDTDLSILEYNDEELVKQRVNEKLKNIESILSKIKEEVNR